jgi:hypothetical protein
MFSPVMQDSITIKRAWVILSELSTSGIYCFVRGNYVHPNKRDIFHSLSFQRE